MNKNTFHPLSAIGLITLDALFSVPEVIAPFSIPLIVVVVFITCMMSVTLTQHFMAQEHWGESLAKGVALGILAGVPFPIIGTGTGIIILAMSGLRGLLPNSKKSLF
jgi:hypothetical protein